MANGRAMLLWQQSSLISDFSDQKTGSISKDSECLYFTKAQIGCTSFRVENMRNNKHKLGTNPCKTPGIFEETTRRNGFRFRSLQHLHIHAP